MYVVEVAFWKGKLQSNVELTKQLKNRGIHFELVFYIAIVHKKEKNRKRYNDYIGNNSIGYFYI